MREIKFRAWDKEDKSFVTKTFNMLIRIGESLQNERFVFTQYTGLKDKHGKEIYEGDILGDLEGYGVVVWLDAVASFAVQEKNGKCFFLNKGENDRPLKLQDSGIIGNIYEHPHLISNGLSEGK